MQYRIPSLCLIKQKDGKEGRNNKIMASRVDSKLHEELKHLYLNTRISKVYSLIHTNLSTKWSSLSGQLVSPLKKCHTRLNPLALNRILM
uniref:Uncharacterized protein n=1 Tax=Falco tinnunculus TaxID=100819 RepID=A0A8C4U7B3_FALTI